MGCNRLFAESETEALTPKHEELKESEKIHAEELRIEAKLREAERIALAKAAKCEEATRSANAALQGLQVAAQFLPALINAQLGELVTTANKSLGLAYQAQGAQLEVAAKEQLSKHGFDPVGLHSKEQGIDLVAKKDGAFFVFEIKSPSARLSNTRDGQQLSRNWTNGRLVEAVGLDTAHEILHSGYECYLVRATSESSFSLTPMKQVNDTGVSRAGRSVDL